MTRDDQSTDDTKSDLGANTDRPNVGTLVDFVEGAAEDNPLGVEIAVDDAGRIVIFHDKPFRSPLALFEYDVTQNRLDFINSAQERRDIGIALDPAIYKHMHNTHQILTVCMNDETGEADGGTYVPLILHQS